MTRIIAGAIGSLQLKTAAKATRPTSDRVKESLFAKLDAMGAIEEAVVLDLFAGTGALGLESASRGAKEVFFVEKDRKAFELLGQNISAAESSFAKQKIEIKLHRHNADAMKILNSMATEFDLIFFDPPYALDAKVKAELLNKSQKFMAPGGLLALEISARSGLFQIKGMKSEDSKAYGDTRVDLFRKIALP